MGHRKDPDLKPWDALDLWGDTFRVYGNDAESQQYISGWHHASKKYANPTGSEPPMWLMGYYDRKARDE
jgi:hypothetical protein